MKKIGLYLFRIIEWGISIGILSFCFIYEIDEELGILLPKDKEWIPLFLFGIMFLFYLLEFVIVKGIKRFFYFLIAGLVCLFLAADSVKLSEINISLCAFSLVYFFIMIVTIARTSVHLKQEKGQTSAWIQRVPSVKGKLNFSYASKRHRMLSYLTLILSFGIGAIFLFLKIHTAFRICLFLGIALILYFICLILINPVNHALRKMNQTANYNEFEIKIKSFYQEPLHPDMLSYLSTLHANYMFTVDKDKAAQLFEGIEKPTFASYLLTYCQIEIVYDINTEKFEEAQAAIERYSKQYPKNVNLFKNYERSIRILGTKDPIANIETLYPLNTKQQFLNLVNAYILMKYYWLREDERAKKYAEYILSNTTELLYYIQIAKEVLNGKEESIEERENETKMLVD